MAFYPWCPSDVLPLGRCRRASPFRTGRQVIFGEYLQCSLSFPYFPRDVLHLVSDLLDPQCHFSNLQKILRGIQCKLSTWRLS